MSKKRKMPAAVQAKAAPAKPNPFELKGSKRNFSVLGKRDKTDKTNVLKSREAAQLKRKKTLLVEYKQLRKANAFIDRRFGEGDPGMDEEERALARLTAQRIRDGKKTSKFALGGDDAADEQGGGLTHGGIPLDQLEDLAALPGDELGDMDEGVLRDIMQEYNFGGGGDGGGAGAEGEGRKTRKQVMEEIIAKSKMYKAQKAREREEEEAQLAALDTAFTALVKGPGLGALVKPAGYDKGRKIAPDNDQDAAYDRAARELVFEAKAHAGERTLSPDELAAKEAERLAVLEKERLKRMRGDTTDTPGDEAAGDTAAADAAEGPQGGYAAKRRRMAEAAAAEERRQQRRNKAGGDAEEEDEFEEGSGSESEGSEGEGGLSALDRRRQERAAGDHPLQQHFRELAARLAEKHGVEAPKNPYLGDSGDEEEDSQGDEEEDEEEDSGSGEESAGEGEEEEEELLVSGAESEQSGSESEQEEEEAGASQQHKAAAGAKGAAAAAAAAEAPSAQQQLKQQQQKQQDKRQQQQQLEGPLDLPYTIPVPADYQQFAALVEGRPPEQLLLAIQRIRAFNAAALASDNKRQLQLLYGLLVQHYAVLAGIVPLPMAHLDVLFGQLLTMVKEVPYYGATVARARLGKLVERLTAAAADPMSAPFHGWPAARQLLQVRLFSCQFPVSDKRHPVVTPLVLYLEKALVQCPVTHALEAALGCLAAGMLLGMAVPAQRYAPEVYVFLAQLLQGFVPKSSSSSGAAAAGGAGAAAAAAAASAAAGTAASDQQVPSLVTPGVLAFSGSTAAAAAGGGVDQSKQVKAGSKKSKKKGQQQQQMANGHHPAADSNAAAIAPLSLSGVLSLQPGDTGAASDAFKLQLLGTVVATASRAAAAAVAACGPALPQVLQPLLTACRSLAGVAGLLAPAAAAVAGLQEQMEGLVVTCVAGRVPLVQTQRLAAPTPKEYNPRYEPEFAPNRSNDPDRARAGAKQLRRAVAKEQRGAMRELRKDAAFMAQARDAERAQVDSERLASERKFYAELQGQEADMRSGGQKGMHPHRKKKK